MYNNLLPYDGDVRYLPECWSEQTADSLCMKLEKDIAWQQDPVKIFGKLHIPKRKVAWYGNKPFAYSYSGNTKIAEPWLPILTEIKTRVEELTRQSYNSCLLNLYPDGRSGMGWHTDNERELQEEGAIASVSFGATRRFVFRHLKTKEKVEQVLEPGSILLMQGVTQQYWQHSLPKSAKVNEARINLTFRTIIS